MPADFSLFDFFNFRSFLDKVSNRLAVTFIISYLISGSLFFVLFLIPASDYTGWGLLKEIALYWLVMLFVPFIIALLAGFHIVFLLVVLVAFCIPSVLLWLSYKTADKPIGYIFCALSAACTATLCGGSIYILGQAG